MMRFVGNRQVVPPGLGSFSPSTQRFRAGQQRDSRHTRMQRGLTGQFPQEFLLVEAVFEGFAAVDEDDGDFVGELAAQAFVGVNVHFAPAEATPALEFGELFLHDFAEMAAFSRIDDDFSWNRDGLGAHCGGHEV